MSEFVRRGILVVEDEMLIMMMVEDMLVEMGHEVVSAASVEQALTLVEGRQFDVAIVDLNLNGVPSEPVIEVLRNRGTPVIIATGYGQRGLPEKFASVPVLSKPFDLDSLKKALARV